jgi:hypothetical protein
MNRVRFQIFIAAMMVQLPSQQASANASAVSRDVRSGIYCLTHGPNPLLAVSKQRVVEAYVLVVDASYPTVPRLLIFVRRSSILFDGFVIEIVSQRQRAYRIVNSATISKTRHGVAFASDPLGGVWTHDFILRGFAEATRGNAVPVSIAMTAKPNCSSFADP